MSNRVAFVTGSSRGIGRATALTLQQAGYAIVVASFEVEKNEEVAAEIRAAGGEAMTSNLNLTSLDSIKSSFAEAYKHFGRIDVLVNNAGVTKDGLAMRMKPEDWNRVLQTTLSAPFLPAQQVLPARVKQRSGRFIIIASGVGQAGTGGQPN